MPIQVVDMTTLLNISGISSGSEVNVIFNMYQTYVWGKGGEWVAFAYLHTEERESKSLSKRKTGGWWWARKLRELNIFTLIIVWHLWIHVCSDRHTQTSPVGELRSELGIVLAKIQLKSKQNGYIPNEKTVNTNGIEWTVCVLVLLKIRTDTTMTAPTPQRGWLSWCCV